MTNTPKPQANALDEILDWNMQMLVGEAILQNVSESKKINITTDMVSKAKAKAKQQIQALITEARIEGGQVSINAEIPKKITGFESMPTMGICRNLTIQDAKINEIIDYLSQLAQLKENK